MFQGEPSNTAARKIDYTPKKHATANSAIIISTFTVFEGTNLLKYISYSEQAAVLALTGVIQESRWKKKNPVTFSPPLSLLMVFIVMGKLSPGDQPQAETR